LQGALDIVQISGENQMELFSMLAVVLWLGNISFSVIDNENHVEVDSNEGTNFPLARLLSVKKEAISFHSFLFR
jgi:myosin heavy subunit